MVPKRLTILDKKIVLLHLIKQAVCCWIQWQDREYVFNVKGVYTGNRFY